MTGGEARRFLRGVALHALLAGPLLVLACSAPGTPAEVSWIDNPDCAEVSREALDAATVTITTADAALPVSVEIAATADERTQGLQCRSAVPAGTGMLFRMPGESTTGFWMYNTYVPLDLLYLDADGRVVRSTGMQPCPRAGGEALPAWQARCLAEAAPHAPGRAYREVLELPAGWLESNGMAPPTLPGRGRVTVDGATGR